MKRSLAFALIAGSFAAVPAFAQGSDDPVQAVLGCRAIQEPMERLACFDASAATLDSAQQAGEVVTVRAEDIEAVERDSFGFSMPSLPRLGLGRVFAARERSERAEPSDPLTDGLEVAEAGADGSPASNADANSTEPGRAASSTDAAETARIVSRDRDGDVNEVVMRIVRTETYGYNKTRFIMENGQVWRQVDTGRVRIPRRADVLDAYIRRAAMDSYLLRVNDRGVAIRVIRER